MSLDITQRKYTNLPDAPGVYFFRGPRRNILYIGKATSLRDRVKSYFSGDITTSRGPGIAHMLEQATRVDWEETDSVLEALLREAQLIKKYQPPYNTKEKDDKSFNYIVITNERFPQVRIVRGHELARAWDESFIKYTFGPFPHAGQLKEALRLIRKIFPFRDTRCTPAEEQTGTPKPCFNRQIGLCPGVCTGEVSKTEYGRTIQHLRLFFQGKKKQLVRKLEREMHTAAQKEQFETAAKIREQLFALKHIQDVSLLKHTQATHEQKETFRIEAYDVAHTSERDRVGVMTVVEDGARKPSEYRQFKIRRSGGGDTGALQEILERRFEHTEWQFPRLIVVDGGKAQINTARSVLKNAGIEIPIVGVVKDERHAPRELLGSQKDIRERYEQAILLANREAHRFAVSFHRRTRRRGMRT